MSDVLPPDDPKESVGGFDRGIDTANLVTHERRHHGDATFLFPTHRHTTSSRKPGRDTGGQHHIRVQLLTRCLDCGGLWTGGVPGHHAPVLRQSALCGHWRTVNCVGRPVGDCPECMAEVGAR